MAKEVGLHFSLGGSAVTEFSHFGCLRWVIALDTRKEKTWPQTESTEPTESTEKRLFFTSVASVARFPVFYLRPSFACRWIDNLIEKTQ